MKTKHLRASLLKHDISSYHQNLIDEENVLEKYKAFKNCFIALDIFRDSFRHFNILLRDNKQLANEARELKRKLQFINHLRNKVSGHVDETLLEKAVQWEPSIFFKAIKEEDKLILSYKAILESAINSYIDKDSQQKVFNTEIDLDYPPNKELFNSFIEELNKDAISFLSELLDILKSKIDFYDQEELMKMAIKAGKTDFNLKNNEANGKR